ncbi:sugar phosphate isomerase/epimerase [Chloroflexi bacterium TSY]|nr:sugar phosphate isomerase/epimerase [Chloroflexi bacterium TSY]
MNIKNIDISFGIPAGPHRFQRLEEGLGFIADLGYTLVEMNPHSLAMIVNGEVRQKILADFVSVLGNFDLHYTIHGLNRLNLAYDPRRELCQKIMRAQIEVCRAVQANVLVYHSGLQALDLVHHGVRQTLLSDEELTIGAQHEVHALRKLAPMAEDAGVIIGMENGDSHLWEHVLIADHDLPREALSKHHARLHIPPIVQQLEAIDHPHVAMTLDIAHLHIAAHDMEFDYLEAVEQAAPWVKHLHANDNFGQLDQGFDTESDRWAYGEADVHMPPGWGSIPYEDVFARLPNYQGDLILEIKAGFADYFGESLQTMRAILNAEES